MADEWAIVRAVREPRCPCSVSSLLDLPDSHKGLELGGREERNSVSVGTFVFDLIKE